MRRLYMGRRCVIANSSRSRRPFLRVPKGLLPASQRMHIDRKLLDGCGIEAVDPGRHHAAMSCLDLVLDGVLRPAIEPDVVGQVGRAKFLIAFALLAVACDAAAVAMENG